LLLPIEKAMKAAIINYEQINEKIPQCNFVVYSQALYEIPA
jgi:hypothetical protein